MKAEEIEKIIKHHLKGNYLTSDAGINLLAKDIMNYSQQETGECTCKAFSRLDCTCFNPQPTEDANKFKQIMEHATAIRDLIAFDEP